MDHSIHALRHSKVEIHQPITECPRRKDVGHALLDGHHGVDKDGDGFEGLLVLRLEVALHVSQGGHEVEQGDSLGAHFHHFLGFAKLARSKLLLSWDTALRSPSSNTYKTSQCLNIGGVPRTGKQHSATSRTVADCLRRSCGANAMVVSWQPLADERLKSLQTSRDLLQPRGGDWKLLERVCLVR